MPRDRTSALAARTAGRGGAEFAKQRLGAELAGSRPRGVGQRLAPRAVCASRAQHRGQPRLRAGGLEHVAHRLEVRATVSRQAPINSSSGGGSMPASQRSRVCSAMRARATPCLRGPSCGALRAWASNVSWATLSRPSARLSEVFAIGGAAWADAVASWPISSAPEAHPGLEQGVLPESRDLRRRLVVDGDRLRRGRRGRRRCRSRPNPETTAIMPSRSQTARCLRRAARRPSSPRPAMDHQSRRLTGRSRRGSAATGR